MEYSLANPNIDMDEIKRRLTDMISDDDIEKYLDKEGHQKIIKYSDLKNYRDIDDLIPKFNDYKIILIETQMNSGHWIVLLKYKIDKKPTIEYFNSYGLKVGADLNFISKAINNMLGQGKNDLDNLLTQAEDKYDIIYNKKRFQSTKKDINTCGRWCILRIIMMKHYGMDLYEFNKFIDNLKTKYGYEPDIICSMLMP
jgi:hypothetical protein